MVEIPEGVWTRLLEIEQSYELVHKGRTKSLVMAIEEGVPWYYDIMKFLELGVYPDSANNRESSSIRIMAMQYILCRGQLYRRSYDGIHPSLLEKGGSRKSHGRSLSRDLRSSHECTMETDCVDFMKSFYDCQTHANLNHVPPSELYRMTSPWPFLIWGIDVIGSIAPKASNGHEYVLVAIDYCTK